MLNIRHFKPTDTEYEEIVRIYNLEWPDNPSTVTNFKFNDETWDKNYLHKRFVAELNGRLIIEGAYMEPYWAIKPGKYQFGYSLDPSYRKYQEGGKDIHTLLLEYVVSELADRHPKSFVTGTREDKHDRIEFLEANGFVFQMRSPESELEIASFDHAKFAAFPEKIAQNGVQIRTLAQLMESDPLWKQKIYDLCWEVEQDIPSPDPPTQEPLEEWEKGFKNPNFLADGWFIALDDEQYVGVTILGADQVLPEKLHTWLTGVLHSHRRKGVATALKLSAIEFAQSRGAKTIDTDNEENNPMYELNIQMGFKPKPAWCDYAKEF
ncbi:GNAT family N-acetyltransferase [Chloroflexi bacterium TSY]|nr:GNAT family N-acetyltransferase [Chloroflexi bacterium TSY]